MNEENSRPPIVILRPHQVPHAGEVSAINAFVPMVGYEDKLIFFRDLIEMRRLKASRNAIPQSWHAYVKDSNVLTRSGDSGSLVISISGKNIANQNKFAAVGIVVGGNAAAGEAGVSYAAKLVDIKQFLQFGLPNHNDSASV